MPDVPIDAVEAGRGDLRRGSAPTSARTCLTSRRSSRLESGSVCTKRSVSRMTPSLKLRASSGAARGPERDLDAAAADVDHDGRTAGDADAVHRGQVDEPRLLGPGDDAGRDPRLAVDRGEELAAVLGFARRAGRDGQDLVDLVRLGEPRNFDSVCSAAAIASAVSARPSSPPAPRRTISFSRSMTSKDRSGRTRTTIMWIELVPMSMAAMRMVRSNLRRNRRVAPFRGAYL